MLSHRCDVDHESGGPQCVKGKSESKASGELLLHVPLPLGASTDYSFYLPRSSRCLQDMAVKRTNEPMLSEFTLCRTS